MGTFSSAMAHVVGAFELLRLGLSTNIINEIYQRTIDRTVWYAGVRYEVASIKPDHNQPFGQDPTKTRESSVIEAIKQWYHLIDTWDYFKTCLEQTDEIRINWWCQPNFGEVIFYRSGANEKEYPDKPTTILPILRTDPPYNKIDPDNKRYYIPVNDYKDFKRKLKKWGVQYYWHGLSVYFQKNNRRMESSVWCSRTDV